MNHPRRRSGPIRVLHVIVPEPPGSVGGADMHVLDLASALRDEGLAEPVVLETLSQPYASRVRATGVTVVSAAGLDRFRTLRRLRSLMASRRFDVIHGHGYDGTWWALAAREMIRPRPELVVTCHGWIETSLRLRVMSALDRASNKVASGIIVVSDELVPTALRSAGRARAFAVVPNGVPVLPQDDVGALRPALGLPPETVLVGAMGRLSPEKRHDVFLAACARVHARRPEVHFVLAGGGPLRDDLVRQADELGLTRRLHLIGVVDQPQRFLRQLDVVVQPSDVETTSRVVLEAMAQGRPVVATRVGGTPSLIRDGHEGLLVPPGAAREIADSTVRLLGDPVLGNRLGTQARHRVERDFSVSAMAEGVHDVYRAVLGEATRRPQTWVRNTHRGARTARKTPAERTSAEGEDHHGVVHRARPDRDSGRATGR